MKDETKIFTANMVLTDAIEDYAINTGQSIEAVREQIIESGAYDDLYDLDTGLWGKGPDYFIDFFLRKKAAGSRIL